MDRIEKNWTELNFDEVDFESGEWSFGCGGYPFQDGEYGISRHCHETESEVVEIRYKMPKCINKMLKRRYENGVVEQQDRVRKALGF